MVRSVPESEWDEEQQGWMLALAEYRTSRCPCGCGHDVRDTTAREGTFTWRTRRVRCQARNVLAEAQRAAETDAEKTRLPSEAVLWSVEKVG